MFLYLLDIYIISRPDNLFIYDKLVQQGCH